LKQNSSALWTQNSIRDPRCSTRSWNVRFDSGAGAAVLWCRLQPQHGVVHRPAGTRFSEGTKDAEGGGGRPPDVPSEIAYAAIGGEVATLPTVLGHHRDHRRHLEHHLEEGDHRWGSLGTPAPRARRFAPLARGEAWGTRTELRSRTRFRNGSRYEANPKVSGGILLDGLR